MTAMVAGRHWQVGRPHRSCLIRQHISTCDKLQLPSALRHPTLPPRDVAYTHSAQLAPLALQSGAGEKQPGRARAAGGRGAPTSDRLQGRSVRAAMQDSAIAGACAGLVSSIVTCPLDVIKTKLQAQGGPDFQPGTALSQGFKGSAGGISGGVGGGLNQLLFPASSGAVVGATGGASALGAHAPHTGVGVRWPEVRSQYARGLRATVRQIWQDDGFRGFYRGLGPTIFGYLPTWAIYFTVYDMAKRRTEPGFVGHILSAMSAGAASTICTSPVWVVKTRFMLQSLRDPSTRPYRHTGDAFVQIYRTEGVRGFYKGLLPSLFGVSHVAVQFPLYETFKGWAAGDEPGRVLDPSSILLCSTTSKMVASVTTYPHEVLRTRLQMQPRRHLQSTGVRHVGIRDTCRQIWREDGVRGFYRGMAVNLIRTLPSSALTILT